VKLRRTIVNEFESEEECNMFIMVLEKNLPLAKEVIGSASVEILRSDQSPKIMSVTWAFEKPEDIKILDQFAEKLLALCRPHIPFDLLICDSVPS
jgi:hypothetical protein